MCLLHYRSVWNNKNTRLIQLIFSLLHNLVCTVSVSLRRHPHEDFKCTKLCLGPIQTRSEAFFGFLGKNKMKAYTKLAVVMCCQIVARKSVAPSSGDFWRQLALRHSCGHTIVQYMHIQSVTFEEQTSLE